MSTTLEIIGLVCITIVGLRFFKFLFEIIYNNFLGNILKIGAVDFEKLGKWAVVTGATDGIGKAYAEALAKKGLSVVLISRTEEKLKTVATQIASKYHVETRIITADFTKPTEIYHHIEKQLTDLDIGVLINNVGMSYPHPEYFTDLKDKDQIYPSIINCNILSVTNMCQIVLPGMINKKRGVIINLSSTAAQIPSPLLSVYAASKAYVDKFTSDLSTEYSQLGLTIQCILPGYVATSMSKIRAATWMAPSPETFVRDALKTVGIQERTTGYFPHTLLVSVVHCIESLSPNLSKWLVMKTMLNIRSRALRRKQR